MLSQMLKVEISNSCNTGLDLIIYIGLLADTYIYQVELIKLFCVNRIMFCDRIFDGERIWSSFPSFGHFNFHRHFVMVLNMGKF